MRKLIHFKKLQHLLLVLFLVAEGLSGWMVYRNYQRNHQAYIQKNAREFEIGLTATLHHFEEVAHTWLFAEALPGEETPMKLIVRQLKAGAADTNLAAQPVFDEIYTKLKQRGFRGVTIVTGDRTVWLRLHNPTYSGDRISTLSALIDSVSLTGKPKIGFYAGGTAAGYCMAFPLSDMGVTVGFVLLSIDNLSLQQEMKKIFPYEFVFLFNKESVLKSTPYSMLSGYHFSDLSVDYFYEKAGSSATTGDVRQYIPLSEIVLFNKINKSEIESGLDQNLPFGLNASTDKGSSYTGLFFPVTGPDHNPAAFIISYSSDSTLRDYRKDAFIILIVTSLLIALIFAFVVFSIRTFRELSEKNSKLAVSESQLQELNIAKDKFFSIIAHDLRNPFHGLVGLAEVLVEDSETIPPEKIRRFHQLIYEGSRQGYQLVNNLLEWTRVQTGRVKYQPERINLSRLIEEVIGQLQLVISAKHVEVQKELAPGLLVWADYQMTAAIIRNLISNAVKYSYQGHPVIIKTQRTTDYARISVIDAGIGMDKATCAGLWRIEESHSSKGTDGEPGTGLGLILVHEFVERNKGTITVKSEPQKGSTFTFTLPLIII